MINLNGEPVEIVVRRNARDNFFFHFGGYGLKPHPQFFYGGFSTSEICTRKLLKLFKDSIKDIGHGITNSVKMTDKSHKGCPVIFHLITAKGNPNLCIRITVGFLTGSFWTTKESAEELASDIHDALSEQANHPINEIEL